MEILLLIVALIVFTLVAQQLLQIIGLYASLFSEKLVSGFFKYSKLLIKFVFKFLIKHLFKFLRSAKPETHDTRWHYESIHGKKLRYDEKGYKLNSIIENPPQDNFEN